jgi:glycosyltransferase involved in cell wall biosynthesis
MQPSAQQIDSVNPRPLRVGFIGRLDPIKRVVDLVRAAAVLSGRATVDIFGDGPDRPAIEREIASAGVSSLVTLHGKIAAPEPALNTLDVLVLPSDAEGFGLVLIEAMAAGVAVIATDVPGIRDVIRDDVNGLLVPRRNPLALAAAIVRLMEDRSLRQRLIDSATEEVHARYDWAAVLPRYRELLGITESAPMLSAS